MIPTLKGAVSRESLLDDNARQVLEQTVLPGYLRAQRWFGGKAQQIQSIRLVDWGELPTPKSQAFLALFEVELAGKGTDLYFLPLGVATGAGADWMLESQAAWVIARLSGPDGDAVLHDALANDSTCTALLDAIGSGREMATRHGQVRMFPTGAFRELRGSDEAPLPVVRGPATSSNSLVFYGERLLLKLFRRLEVGVNPDFEIGRFLTEESPFDRIPRVAGAMEYQRGGQGPITLAILQALVPNQGDGWRHVLAELAPYYERVATQTPTGEGLTPDRRPLPELAQQTPPAAVREAIGSYLQTAATLGRRTAQMHLALAGAANNPAFAPQPRSPTDAAALFDSIRREAKLSLTALRDNRERLPEEVRLEAGQLLEEGPRALERLGEGTPFRASATKIRCHGDYHLGQVLWVDNDFIILDFEGEPTRTVEQRRAKVSPLRDVAGMVRSYHYAAYAGLFNYTQNRPEDFGRLEPWAELWYQWTAASFLRAYRETAREADFLPSDPSSFTALLDGFMMEKAFYELAYELNNRPDWVRIPLRGILNLLAEEARTN
jgi:maltose alpha-D-glucosyltransferase/alpha-amylase